MRNREVFIGLLLSFFLFSFSLGKKEGTITISEVSEGNSVYTLKCNKLLNEENKLGHQYFLEVYSTNDPRRSFDTDEDYAKYTQFQLQELFEIKINGKEAKVFGSRLELGIKGSNVYRINLYFENDALKKIKDLEVDFDDQLFENKKIILTAKKVKL